MYLLPSFSILVIVFTCNALTKYLFFVVFCVFVTLLKRIILFESCLRTKARKASQAVFQHFSFVCRRCTNGNKSLYLRRLPNINAEAAALPSGVSIRQSFNAETFWRPRAQAFVFSAHRQREVRSSASCSVNLPKAWAFS